MSGRVIGGVLGAVVGSFIPGVGTQLGWLIGSMFGGFVDPDKIYGPRLTDAAQQTAQDGIPRTYGWGTFPTAGNIIWTDDLKEHKEEDDGKGGPVSVTYTYTRSYAIAVARGPITGYLIIKRNGKIVYDTRPDAVLTALGYTSRQIAETRAAQAKFEQTVTFYYGDDTQGADPTMTAVLGAGNVPKYRGTAYIVVTDDDVTEMGGAIPQYEFVVSVCGTRTTDDYSPLGGQLLVTGRPATLGGSPFAMAPAKTEPEFVALVAANGADLIDCVPAVSGSTLAAFGSGEARYSTDGGINWSSTTLPWGATGAFDAFGFEGGFFVRDLRFGGDEGHPGVASEVPTDLAAKTYTLGSDAGQTTIARCWQLSDKWVIASSLGTQLFYASSPNETTWPRLDSGNADFVFYNDLCEFGGALYAAGMVDDSPLRVQLRRSNDGGVSWPDLIYEDNTHCPWQLAVVGGVLVCYSRGGEYCRSSADDFAENHATGLRWNKTGDGLNYWNEEHGRMMAVSEGRLFIISGYDGDGSAKGDRCVSTTNGITFSDPVPLAITHASGIAVYAQGLDYSAIPDADGYFINPETGEIVGPPGTTIDRCIPTLGEIVADCCDSRGVTSRDVSELTDDVQGLRVASVSSAQATIASTMPAYFFDSSEYDGKIHFPKRGGATTFAITTDDLVTRDGDPIEWERVQEPELLRKVTVSYVDPDTTYTVRTQDWERRAGTIKAQGSSTLELPITGSKDWAKQGAEKTGKVAWAEGDKCKFSLSALEWATLVPAQVGYLTDEDSTVHRIRLTKLELDGGTLLVEATKERNNTYVSNAVGNAGVPPKYPGSTLYGPTDGLLLNIPALSTDHDQPGLYWAASGFLGFQWRGATLQIDKGAGWTTAATTTRPSVLGTLTAGLPDADRDYTDTANTLSVRVNGTLSSVTWEAMLNGANAAAILYDDGTAEIVQWQTATQTGSGEYDLTTLQRGRLDTTTGNHASGARFVLLDSSLTFVPLAAADLGATIGTRNVTAGTDADAAPTDSISLTTLESAREWSVANLAASRNDDDDVTVTWDGRPRFGSGVQPSQSSNFIGYRIEYSDGTTTVTKTIARTPLVIIGGIVQTAETTTHTYTATEQTADFGSLPTSLDVTVYAVNDISGAGPGEETTV